MITVRHSELIRLPLADVYGILACYDNDLLWRSNLSQINQDAPGMARTGMRLRQEIRLFDQRITVQAEVTAAAPNRRTAYVSVDGPVELWEQRIFERVEKDTRLTYELSVELKGWQRLMAPLLISQLQRQFRADLLRLKQLLEETPNPVIELPKRLAGGDPPIS
ncbi:SRPBCC family protein [Larkinella soli]|uniref:SRPBCC family protein n=1 Tax=Larkinella soli TaxID=1770527 RepID=UPI000FFC99A1|nr:SRPBCC family protein [Larkinella soli]